MRTKKKINFFGLLLLTVSFLSANSFICSKDPVYINYKKGNRLDLDGAIKYAGKDICENNCRDYTTCVYDSKVKGYYCPIRKSENLGGNIDGGHFSSKSKCNGVCYSQNPCAEIRVNPCKPVNIEYRNPVTDYTGKTVYTQRKVTLECTKTTTKQVGCAKWEIKTNNGSFDYNLTNIPTIWKSRTSTDEAQATMAMLEQQLHIFSGWPGYCEDGIMFNNPFSNPMAILGYAVMVYNVMGTGDLGEGAKSLHDGVKSAFDSTADKLKSLNPFKSGGAQTGTLIKGIAGKGAPTTAGALTGDDIVHGIAGQGAPTPPPIPTSLTDTLTQANKITTIVSKDSIGLLSSDINLLWTDVAQAAMLLMPSKEEMQQADYFNKAWMGSSDTDEAALAYANCMASIGLSMPNMVSSTVDDVKGTSPELREFWMNPIRFTPDQLSILVSATSLKYVKVAYLQYDYQKSPEMMTLIARNRAAYYEAGQVICSGKLAIAQNMLTHQANEVNAKSGNGIAKSLAIMAVKKVLAAVNPVVGLIGSLVIDIVTSLENGDACHDTDIAVKWGLIQLKTNKFLNFDQCHFLESECAAKWFWGSCMRDRNKYCCYDQISTRIFAEGIKAQMYPAKDPATGLPNKKMWASCNDITINDLKNISFRKCKTYEDPYEDHCFPRDKYDEFVTAIRKSGVVDFDFQDVANQAINSLAIPNKLCK